MGKINYLEKAVKVEYKKKYTQKGLKLRAKPFIDTALPLNPKRILIVGMALGGQEEVEAMKHYFPDYDVYGIDVIKSSLNKKIKAKLFYSDVSNIKIKENFFSGVMCSAVMHEVYSFSKAGLKKVEKSISEIKRVLCKNGIGAIREFFIPDSTSVRVVMLSEEAKKFSKIFVSKFGNHLDKEFKKNFYIKGDIINTDLRFAYELLLHFRVYKAHFNNVVNFLISKEIEETYLPITVPEYLEIFWKQGLEIIKIEYTDFPKYYPIIEENFKVLDEESNKIENFFGFIDLIFRKK